MNKEDKETFSFVGSNAFDQEMKEITDFFDKVSSVKNRILQEKENSDYKNQNNLNDEQILQLLSNNVNFFNVITEDTIKIYIYSFFEKENEMSTNFKFTEEALENFLTSILIFAQD